MNKLFFFLLVTLFSFISLAEQEEPTSQEEDINSMVEIQENEEGDAIEEESTESYTKFAKIQILNKITAKAKTLNLPVNSQLNFGTLIIKVLKCVKSSPYEFNENKIFMEISEKKTGQDTSKIIFRGWMFSSSPSISSLEHAVYDVTAVSCYE